MSYVMQLFELLGLKPDTEFLIGEKGNQKRAYIRPDLNVMEIGGTRQKPNYRYDVPLEIDGNPVTILDVVLDEYPIEKLDK